MCISQHVCQLSSAVAEHIIAIVTYYMGLVMLVPGEGGNCI
jgi:hypothetical protein